MSNELIETIISEKETIRNRSVTALLQGRKKDELLHIAGELDLFRRTSANLYHKVRACLFLFVIYRFYLQEHREISGCGEIPFEGVKASFNREFETALEIYLNKGEQNGAVFSAVADSYYRLSFAYLLDQVKLAISRCAENYYLYNVSGLDDYPFSVDGHLTEPDTDSGTYPVGMDAAPVRLDPSHSGWSDIFFLGMDFPEGARVINLSVNLSVYGSNGPVLPPCECYCRFIEEPVIHLVSIDLSAEKTVTSIQELFNFGNDYLSLLKAGVVASGIIPPCFENKDIPLKDVLSRLLNKDGGIEIVTRVNSIPKGSRLAVSTTLLSTIITRLMRFSSQITNRTGGLSEDDRRIVASRAILGEWLGGSGGGWQDSGGLWPGIKVIYGKQAEEGQPEFGVSRGGLLPGHKVFTRDEMPKDVEEKILDSLVLVHGGISQDVGPILEMVTEKYLLKYEKEWSARLKGIELFDRIVSALKAGNMEELGRLTTEDWNESIQEVIPWVNNAFTDTLIERLKGEFREDYLGFLMLGGMSGGGMAFIVNPEIRELFRKRAGEIMLELKQLYCSSFPFIIDPVVYEFELNHDGITAQLFRGTEAVIPELSSDTDMSNDTHLFSDDGLSESQIKNRYGFDERSHEHMKKLLKSGRIGLSENRLSEDSVIRDVRHDDILHFENAGGFSNKTVSNEYYQTGLDSLRKNEIAVVTFAGGMGSRWTQGSAVVKAIHPFIKISGKYRTFIECHLAKSRKTGQLYGRMPTHVFTTSYLTHDAIQRFLERFHYYEYEGNIYLSPSRSIGHRVYPMVRDLRFYWEEQLQQKMDENIQKVQDNVRKALMEWTRSKGEGEDYAENRHILRFNPPGHWYEVPNLLKNGMLARMIRENENLNYLLCHNIDTLGACIEPELLGMHILHEPCVTFEVTPRRIEDAGGGLADINGHIRLVEGLALPREEDEYRLSYYNTLTNWVTIDSLLDFFGLDRRLLLESEENPELMSKIHESLYSIEKRIPAYVTIKNVKYVWGSGQEDVYPVAQFEKLWGDMSGLNDLKACYISVPRLRGQQLKEPSMLDIWTNDGSFEYVTDRCAFRIHS